MRTQYEPFDGWPHPNAFREDQLCQRRSIGEVENPYKKAIFVIGQTLAPFVEDNRIPCFGFGRSTNHDEKVFSFHCDSQQEKSTMEAIVDESSYAMSIVIVSVGDVPWADMKKFDDMIPKHQEERFIRVRQRNSICSCCSNGDYALVSRAKKINLWPPLFLIHLQFVPSYPRLYQTQTNILGS
ncbi:hypothetical protein HID58_061934 [Brassica napus]|uniref:Copine C-terminal domain-containing protein n=1 Tax=Brassica napus TaxID=3708 RepID=A0ABQ8A074_BRANA|nr:hypothetical protein HID58_061934 [Brassica napus]